MKITDTYVLEVKFDPNKEHIRLNVRKDIGFHLKTNFFQGNFKMLRPYLELTFISMIVISISSARLIQTSLGPVLGERLEAYDM